MKGKVAYGLLKLLGWKIVGAVPTIPKCILIVAPHTSRARTKSTSFDVVLIGQIKNTRIHVLCCL